MNDVTKLYSFLEPSNNCLPKVDCVVESLKSRVGVPKNILGGSTLAMCTHFPAYQKINNRKYSPLTRKRSTMAVNGGRFGRRSNALSNAIFIFFTTNIGGI